jgi:hypothetical protein
MTSCAETSEESASEQYVVATSLLKEYPANQTAADNFYAYNNVVNIKIEMSDAEWLALKTELPTPQGCDHIPLDANGEDVERFPWRGTTKVTVSGSNYLPAGVAFTEVEIKKKSYCGSLTTGANEKPSLKLRFKGQAAVTAMGLQYLDLNNSKQDDSYVRQTLGYYLIGMAGLPRPRSNYAKVQVVTPTKTETLVYVNVEPLRGSFINNPANKFTNNTLTLPSSGDAYAPGNLYELDHLDDLKPNDVQTYIAPENVSAIKGTTKPDLRYAAAQLAASPTAATLQEVINADEFVKFWAMEVLLKHRDGHTQNLNNTYIYNDAVATTGTQSPATVDFKFIHWGIDWILRPDFNYMVVGNSRVSSIALSDTGLYRKFLAEIANLRDTVFSRAKLEGEIKTRLDTLQSQLLSLGLDKTAQINEIRMQLKLSRSAAIRMAGINSSSIYLADYATGDVMHASTLETVPNTTYYEIYHRAAATDASDRWTVGYNAYGRTLTNEAYGRNLFASPTLMTSANHPYIFQVPPGTNPRYEAWDWAWEADLGEYPGTVLLWNTGTNTYPHFSAVSDLTPQGRPRIYQGSPATRFVLY